mgnify:CR=1 FL=1
MAKNIARHILIKNQILDELQRGGLAKNGRLPSEEELAIIYDTSRTTIRSALQSLEADGIIEKRHGSGTFIKAPEASRHHNAVFAMMGTSLAGNQTMKSCSSRDCVLDERIAGILQEKPGEPAVEIRKIFCIGEHESTAMIEYIPLKHIRIMPDIHTLPPSVYVFAARFCGIQIKEIHSEMQAVMPGESPFLTVSTPIIKAEEWFSDENGNRILYSDFFINTKLFRPCIIRDRPPQYWTLREGE